MSLPERSSAPGHQDRGDISVSAGPAWLCNALASPVVSWCGLCSPVQAEDDGVVLSFVSAAEGGSFLLVLDAERFEEIARVKMPHGIPYGFHGTFASC